MPVEKTLPAPWSNELPDDLRWLGEHQGTPYTLPSVHLIVRPLVGALEKHDRELAEARHSFGTTFIDLITHGAVQTLGCATVTEFFEKHLQLPLQRGCEYMRFAKEVTAEQATTYRYTRCMLGLTLCQRLGRADLNALAAEPIEVPQDDGKTELVEFTPKTPVSKLRHALQQLKPAKDAEPETPTRTAARRYREMSALVDDFNEQHPVLAEARLKVTLYAGQPRVRHDPLVTNEQFVAAEKLYAELKKIR